MPCVALASRALLLVWLGAVARGVPVHRAGREHADISPADQLDLERAVEPAMQCAQYLPGGPEACKNRRSARTNKRSRTWTLSWGAYYSAKKCNQYYGATLPTAPPAPPPNSVDECACSRMRSLQRSGSADVPKPWQHGSEVLPTLGDL